MKSGSLILLVAALTICHAEAQNSSAPSPTFTHDVAPILMAHCVSCHRSGGSAPMSLLTFDQVRPWARSIKARVIAREMPPWHADPQFGVFKNDPALNIADIETLARWADNGAPRGEGPPPTPPTFIEGWSSAMNRAPDVVIEPPTVFEIPPTGVLPTFVIWVKLPFSGERWVEAVEMYPSNRRVMHHGSANVGPMPVDAEIGNGPAWPGGPAIANVLVRKDGRPWMARSPEDFGRPLIFYVPGGGFFRYPPGVAKHIAAGDVVSFGLHYTTTGKTERDRPRIGLWFTKEHIRREARTITITDTKFVDGREVARDSLGRALIPNIPPFASDWSITGVTTFHEDVMLHALWPHMHLRGRDMKFSMVAPEGRETILLSVPKYDPFWQATYELREPLVLPPGTTLRAVAHYDNSAANRRNPAPNEEVRWGWQTWEEMFYPYAEVSLLRNALAR
jgi:hypothetical protein